jgi:hypothetical protein
MSTLCRAKESVNGTLMTRIVSDKTRKGLRQSVLSASSAFYQLAP